MGTILFIHGTGVRSEGYQPAFRDAESRASEEKIPYKFVPCPWGDVFGARFSPKSLPGDEFTEQLDEEEKKDLAHWDFLFEDPMFELRTLTIPEQEGDDTEGLGGGAEYQKVWAKIEAYQPSIELAAILKREQLTPYWEPAFKAIMEDGDTAKAFRVTGDRTAESSDALARALVAKMTVLAAEAGGSGPGRDGRKALVERMKEDWGQQVYGVGAFFADLFARPVTYVLKQRRSQWSQAITNPIGDILLYQSHGDDIREYLQKKIAPLEKPVVLMAHSLGGIACVDLLVRKMVKADKLITFGSQAPYLYEMYALESLRPPARLPDDFPPWLNLYDENDFLSFRAAPVFGESKKVKDVEINTGRPFPASHSAYLASKKTWAAIRSFLEQ